MNPIHALPEEHGMEENKSTAINGNSYNEAQHDSVIAINATASPISKNGGDCGTPPSVSGSGGFVTPNTAPFSPVFSSSIATRKVGKKNSNYKSNLPPESRGGGTREVKQFAAKKLASASMDGLRISSSSFESSRNDKSQRMQRLRQSSDRSQPADISGTAPNTELFTPIRLGGWNISRPSSFRSLGGSFDQRDGFCSSSSAPNSRHSSRHNTPNSSRPSTPNSSQYLRRSQVNNGSSALALLTQSLEAAAAGSTQHMNGKSPYSTVTPAQPSNAERRSNFLAPFNFMMMRESGTLRSDNFTVNDYRTLLRQMVVLRKQCEAQFTMHRQQEDAQLLTAWWVTHDAERRAAGLKGGIKSAVDIVDMHARLKSVAEVSDSVNDSIGPVLEVLSSYIKLKVAQKEVEEEFRSVHAYKTKTAVQQEFGQKMGTLASSLGSLKRTCDRAERAFRTPIKQQADRINSKESSIANTPGESRTHSRHGSLNVISGAKVFDHQHHVNHQPATADGASGVVHLPAPSIGSTEELLRSAADKLSRELGNGLSRDNSVEICQTQDLQHESQRRKNGNGIASDQGKPQGSSYDRDDQSSPQPKRSDSIYYTSQLDKIGSCDSDNLLQQHGSTSYSLSNDEDEEELEVLYSQQK